MRKRVPLMSLGLLLAIAVGAWAQEPAKPPAATDVNITGVWEMTVATQQGDRVNDATFTQEKEALKGVLTGPDGSPIEGTGTVKEGVVQWTVTFDTPNGAFTIAFSGKIDGEKMAGEIQMGDFGTANWSAKKKK
jgi:hypothetical protein